MDTPTPGVLDQRVHKLLKTKGERYRNVQRVQKLLKIEKMSLDEVNQTESRGDRREEVAKPVMRPTARGF
jgi:hypothetical protein